MNKTTLSVALLAGAFGVLAFTSNITAAGCPMTGCTMSSCCGGMTSPMSDAATNAVPDLLTTCPVSGEKLDEMGKPYVFAYKGQEVKLCCSDCKKKFDKNPAKYMAKIRAADKPDKK